MSKDLEFHEYGESISGWIAVLKETEDVHEPVHELELLLESAFAATQAATHVITGSLKASGKTDSNYDGDEWSGEISYGGALWKTPAPGPAHDPVVYAIYEMARGGDHDFFGMLPAYDGKVEEILMKHFKG